MITITHLYKLLFLFAVMSMAISFYTALAGGYASDYGAEDDSPEQKNRILICNITITLSVLSLISSITLFIYDTFYQ